MSIHKKGNTYWVCIYTNDEEGKKKSKWVNTNTASKTEAQKLERKIRSEIDDDTFVKPNNITFADYMLDWLHNVIKNKVEPTTYDGYVINIEKHISPYFKQKGLKLCEIKTIHLQKYFDQKYKDGRCDGKGGLSANFLKKQYHNIRKALDYAIKMELLKTNPANFVELPKLEKYQAKYYTAEQAEELLKASIGSNIETAVHLAVYFGLRHGEVLGLRWCDVDFLSGVIHIRNTRTCVKTPVEKKPKTESSLRTLPIPYVLQEYLVNLQLRQTEDKKLFGDTYQENDYVCKSPDGKPLVVGTLNYTFSELCKKHNLPHIRFHDLRHSTASYLYKAGVPLKDIQMWLGHSTINVTADLYTHIDVKQKTLTANVINNIFSKGK